MNFLNQFRSIKFFESMVRKRKLAVFEGSSISETGEAHPPKLVCMHLTSIFACMDFLSKFRSIKFFDDHGL